MAFLANPIAVEQDNGTLIRLHCGNPGERCNVDDAKNQSRVPWSEAFMLLMDAPTEAEFDADQTAETLMEKFLCVYCFER